MNTKDENSLPETNAFRPQFYTEQASTMLRAADLALNSGGANGLLRSLEYVKLAESYLTIAKSKIQGELF